MAEPGRSIARRCRRDLVMRGLAFRRHQRQRARERAIRYLRWLFAWDAEWITPRQVARYAVDRVPCSCAMCGNPRRYHGELTRQELRASARQADADFRRCDPAGRV